jgi:hypothetical protein
MNLLPVVLNIAPHEKRQAERLVRYIKALDGTDVITMEFPDPPGMRYPEVANWAFKQCAKEMRGKPFVWIEADSIPLKAGWLKALTEEYHRQGKPYLYIKTNNPPFDNCTGIGVQGPDAFEQVPDNLKQCGFDVWIINHYQEHIGRTDLIQHSYGIYNSSGHATLHEFPRDLSIIRPDAVIFHKDQKQGLIDHVMPSMASAAVSTVSSTGDLGDIVVSLATLKHRGGTYDYYLRDSPATKGIVGRADIIKPLLLSQPFINSVRIWRCEPVDWASEDFRGGWHDRKRNLAMAHAHHAFDTGFIETLPDTSKPWLEVEPSSRTAGRVVINRSPRYQNNYFPWHEVVSHYGESLVFIGLPNEHRDFQENFGRVSYLFTENILEVAQAIAGSDLFIGNQSSCMTIAEGLKHPRILEASLDVPDCIYPPSNAQYVFDGSMTLPAAAGKGERRCKSSWIHPGNFDTSIVPRVGRNYGWYWEGYGVQIITSTVRKTASKVARITGMSQSEAEKEVIMATVRAAPHNFANSIRSAQFQAAKMSLMENGWETHPIFDVMSGQIDALL